jgi:asparagine synthase (glutamine-hydrolysing)
MCGICGYVSLTDIGIAKLQMMNDSMQHRGPDDSGEVIHTIGARYLGLAQRRLSIIDLSHSGHQPMYSEDRKIALVFNGEIYNYIDLRRQLSDYIFISSTDTEVIVAAYRKWGTEFIHRLNGMFVIALFDFERNELIIARDRIGKKPLYYFVNDNVFIFGSELKPIMLHPQFIKSINTNVMGRYLFHGYINSPDSIFHNTYKVEPGQYIVISDGGVEKIKYWDAIDVYLQNRKVIEGDYSTAKKTLKGLIIDSVTRRMISDVPVGTFLSGGIDSSLITAIAQTTRSTPIKTFTIGFHDSEYNEAQFANTIARHIGSDHHELYIDESEMCNLVASIPDYFDEPMADSSQIPTMLVSKLAKAEVSVVLTGDGGDELFCGYGRYDWADQARKYDIIGAMLYNATKMPMIKRLGIESHFPSSIQTVMKNRNDEQKSQCIGTFNIDICCEMLIDSQRDIKYSIERRMDTNNWMQRLMLVDLLTVLPEDLLQKVDKSSMKYSLEARCPLLDYRIVEYSFHIPHKYKYMNGDKKHILKDILFDYVPKELMDRPKKGFSVPIQKWMKNELYESLSRYSKRDILIEQNIFNPDVIEKMVVELGHTKQNEKCRITKYLWSFYVFQLWYERYISRL